MATIWIVRRHESAPYWSGRGFFRSFEIVSTHANRADAAAEAKRRNDHPNTWKLYTIGKVSLKGE